MKKRPAARRPALDRLREDFAFPVSRIRTMMASFRDEMERGLRGEPGSLRMLPAFVDNPTGRERGAFAALDLGGTNYRVLRVELSGGAAAPSVRAAKFRLEAGLIAGEGAALFGAVARSVRSFLESPGPGAPVPLGFTFSFPIRQSSIDRGELIAWTKGWSASGVEGRDVVALLNEALSREGAAGVRAVALDNDTTGTQVARAYLDPSCDIGCILGTGTNMCCRERVAAIRKPIGGYAGEFMIINMESGNFDKDLPRNRFDVLLDEASENPGGQWEEKMVSGKYLGEIVRLAAAEEIRAGRLFGGRLPEGLAGRESLSSETVSAIADDGSPRAAKVRALLEGLGAAEADEEDARAVRDIARMVTGRAARVAAAALSAAALHIDPGLERSHTVAVDGSVFEKVPGFASRMDETFVEIFGERAGRIRPVLTRDGSGIGAAIIAAVAVSSKP